MVERRLCDSGPISLGTTEVAPPPPGFILHICLKYIYNFVIMIEIVNLLLVYSVHMTSIACPSYLKRDPSSVVLPELSSSKNLFGEFFFCDVQIGKVPLGKGMTHDFGLYT